MGFKKIRSLKIPEEQQGLIRYTCLCYSYQDEATREKIDSLVVSVGKDNAEALRAIMCSRKPIRMIAMDYYVSERTLYRLRQEFYEKW